MSEAEAHLQLAFVWGTVSSSPVDEKRTRARLHIAAALRDPATRSRAHLVAAMLLLLDKKPTAAEREIAAGLRDDPGDAGLLHAQVELLLERGADASRPAERLRRAARTAEQLCMLARYDLSRGRIDSARSLVARGRRMKPRSIKCRAVGESLASPPRRP